MRVCQVSTTSSLDQLVEMAAGGGALFCTGGVPDVEQRVLLSQEPPLTTPTARTEGPSPVATGVWTSGLVGGGCWVNWGFGAGTEGSHMAYEERGGDGRARRKVSMGRVESKQAGGSGLGESGLRQGGRPILVNREIRERIYCS